LNQPGQLGFSYPSLGNAEPCRGDTDLLQELVCVQTLSLGAMQGISDVMYTDSCHRLHSTRSLAVGVAVIVFACANGAFCPVGSGLELDNGY
jgi:hypothetical protein